MKKAPTILVTGCAGFIGSNFVKSFKEEFPAATIVGIDDFSTGRTDALDPSITFYKGSVTDTVLVDTLFARHRPAYVFHFAALPRVSYSVLEPHKTSTVNILGIVALLEAAKKYGVKRFIYSSSSLVYGMAKHRPTSEAMNPPDPKSPAAVQKHAGEQFCKVFSELYGIETVCLRYFNVFGPGEYGSSPHATLIAAWLESLYFPNKKKATIEGDGLQSRDFCYVDDVVRANILAMRSTKRLSGATLNIASGTAVTVRTVRKTLESAVGKKLNLKQQPPRKGDVRHTHADIGKARRFINYRPQVTFAEGVANTVRWFENRDR